jgi:hypothetical protein
MKAQSQDSKDQKAIEFYMGMSDANKNPLSIVPGVEIDITIAGIDGEILFTKKFVRGARDQRSWSTSSGGNQTGYVITVDKSDIDRSWVSPKGTATIRVDQSTSYFDLETSVFYLPEASEAEKDARSDKEFEANAVPLSNNPYLTLDSTVGDWVTTPLMAGCFEGFDTYGNTISGIRVEISLQNLTDKLETFRSDVKLLNSSGVLIDHQSSTSTIRMQLMPNAEGVGAAIFEDLECIPSTYTLVVADWRDEINIQEEFALP